MNENSFSVIALMIQTVVLLVLIVWTARTLMRERFSEPVAFTAFALACFLLSDLYWIAWMLLEPEARLPFAVNEIGECAVYLLLAAALRTQLADAPRFTGARTLLSALFVACNVGLWIAWSGETRALPMDAWMQLQLVGGGQPLIRYDEATGTEFLDVNRDGKPDLQAAYDAAANCTNLTRLTDCAAFGEFSLTFSGPTDHYSTITFIIPAPAFGAPDFTLPAALTTVEAEAFEGIAASIVDVPESCTGIGEHAFRNCPNLTQIRIPAGCALGTDVFDGCALVYIFGTAGSSAEAYCRSRANCVFVEVSSD